MNIKSEKGFTGMDIAISVVILFIFVSVMAILSYNISSAKREIDLKSEALYIAIDEIEKIKVNGIIEGEDLEVEEIEVKEGFYKTVTSIDYADIEGNEDKVRDLVKKVTVKITYMFKAQEQNVEISTIVSKNV